MRQKRPGTARAEDPIETALRLSELAGVALLEGRPNRAAALYREAVPYARTPEGRRVLEEHADRAEAMALTPLTVEARPALVAVRSRS